MCRVVQHATKNMNREGYHGPLWCMLQHGVEQNFGFVNCKSVKIVHNNISILRVKGKYLGMIPHNSDFDVFQLALFCEFTAINTRAIQLLMKLFLVADTRLYILLCRSVGRYVGPSVGRSVTFLNSERFSHYCSCPTVRDWIAVYPALFFLLRTKNYFEMNSSS